MAEEPTLKQIRYALALAEHKSFRRAAKASHVSQPALSAQIQQLERGLGVLLFERGRQVLVTPAGKAFLEHAAEVTRAVSDLVGATQQAETPLAGRLRMGLIPTVAPYVLPPVLPALRQAFPRLKLLLHEGQTSEVVRRIEAGELDVGLLALEAELGKLEQLPISVDPFFVALPPGHPQREARAFEEADLSDMEGPFLLLEDGHCLRDQSLAICEPGGVRSWLDFRASSMATLLQMVAAGSGITLLPELVVRHEQQRFPEVTYVPFRGKPPHRTLGLVFRKSSPRRDEFEMLQKLLVRVMRGERPAATS